MTIDIGPGRNFQTHDDLPVVRVDRRVETRPTVVADVRALPFRSGSFSTVYASHVLEHFHGRETNGILIEWFRVARAGGEIHVSVPNMVWVAFQILNGIFDNFVLNATYGRQEYDLDVHRTGFTPQSLRDFLEMLKPRSVFMRTSRNSILAWCVK